MFGTMVLCSGGQAQVSIRERVAITPSGKSIRSDLAPTTQTCWVTPDSGLLILMPGIPSRYECNVSIFEMSQPVFRHHCGYTNSPDKWTDTIGHVRKGTEVAMSMVEVSTSIRLDASYLFTEYLAPDSSKLEAQFNYPGGYDGWYSWIHFERGSDFDHFRIAFSPDTIKYRDSSIITVTAVDAANQEVSLDTNMSISYSLDSTRYGQFINSSGQRVSSPLTGVRYAEAKLGRVRFVANGDKDTLAYKPIAFWVTGAQKTGIDSLFLRRSRVVFTPVQRDTVYPTYAGHNVDSAHRNYILLEVRTYSGDSIAPRTPVLVGRPNLVDGGGHSHSTNRPLGTFALRSISDTSVWIEHDTLYRKSDNVGKFQFRFRASEFGGQEKIKVCLAADTLVFDTLRVWTIVPRLLLLPNSSALEKIGGTCGHHGPGSSPCTTPDNNHFAATVVTDSLPLMAAAWRDSLGESRLAINDISLPNGGLFDVDTNWTTEHLEHREGLDVDVRTAIPGPDGRVGVEVRDANGKWKGNKAFEGLAKAYGVKKLDGHKKGTSREHYHLDY
jgi:hypothetical protein